VTSFCTESAKSALRKLFCAYKAARWTPRGKPFSLLPSLHQYLSVSGRQVLSVSSRQVRLFLFPWRTSRLPEPLPLYKKEPTYSPQWQNCRIASALCNPNLSWQETIRVEPANAPSAMASNGFLSANLPDGMPANRRRSASITPSQRSSRSRITLVENDPDLVADDVVKADGINKVVIYRTPKYTWRDHLRGVFGFKVSKGKELFVEEDFEQPKVLQEPEVRHHVLNSNVLY
jgi:hypothetical protein